MPIKKKVTGTGFTKRRHTVISEPFGDEEVRAIKDSVDAHEDDLDMIERNCKAILQRANLPDSQRVVVWREGGSWREAPDGFDTEPISGDETIGSLNGRVGDGHQISEDSPEGYASRMLVRLSNLRGAIRGGDADRAGREGLYLGALWREADMKRRVEQPALHGQKFERGPKNPRLDDLGKAIEAVLKDLDDNATARDVWEELWDRSDEGFGPAPYDIIGARDENEPDVMYRKRRKDGKVVRLTFDSFETRLSRQRQKRKTADL